MIESGADVNAQNQHKETPLYFAVELGNTSLFNKTYWMDRLFSSLDFFRLCFLGSDEIIKSLLEHGGNASIANKDGLTPFFLAIKNSNSRKSCQIHFNSIENDQFQFSENENALTSFIETGTDINTKNQDGNTALHYAAENGSLFKMKRSLDFFTE